MPTLLEAPPTDESVEDAVARIHRNPIHALYFLPDRDIDVGHVRSVFGDETVGQDEDVLEALVQKVKSVKKDAFSWGNQQIEQQIIAHLSELGPGRNISNFTQVLQYWKEDGSIEAAGKLWDAVYGAFDRKPTWEVQLEKTYMEMKGFTYRELQGKGCFAKLFSISKNTRIKAINRASKTTHKGQIRLKRKSAEVDPKTKFKKRKKGTTLGGFAVLNGEVQFNPDQAVAEARKTISCKQLAQVAKAIHPDNNTKCDSKSNVTASPDISAITASSSPPPSPRRTSITLKLQQELGEQKRVNAQQRKLLLAQTARNQDQVTQAKMKENKATMKAAAAKNNRKKAPAKKKKASGKKKEPAKKKKKAPAKNDEDSDEGEESDEDEEQPPKAAAKKSPPTKNAENEDDDDDEPMISSPEPSEPEDELEPITLVCHKCNKDGEMQVQVDWESQKIRNSQMLYDMWADYPEEVLKYRKANKLSNQKAWKKPNFESIEYVVRILSMVGDNGDVKNASFCTLWNNGFKVENTSYAELEEDASDLLEKFLSSIEDMPEAEAEFVN